METPIFIASYIRMFREKAQLKGLRHNGDKVCKIWCFSLTFSLPLTCLQKYDKYCTFIF